MSDTVIFVLELIGTVAFAASGAMTGASKKMDIFGVCTLGVATAVGGGVIRDLILGRTPPATFSDPVYALVAIAVSVIVFIPAVRRFFAKNRALYDGVTLVMDAVGLGIFTVVGIQAARVSGHGEDIFLQLFVGVVTGVGGGILRDLFARDTPYIFVKHFYASASLIGAAVCLLLWRYAGQAPAIIGGALTVIVLRMIAAHFRWSLPKAKEVE